MGSLDPDFGRQRVEFSIIYRGRRYAVGYEFPPHMEEMRGLVEGSLRRLWRMLREGMRRAMHGENFRERWAIERMKRAQIQSWDRFQAPLHGLVERQYAREGFLRKLERMLGRTPPYTGHDYARRVNDEHRLAVQTGTH